MNVSKIIISLNEIINANSIKEILKPYNLSGIYAIYYNNEIVYIGSSKNMANRWKIHKHYIIKPLEKCSKYRADFRPLYKNLRKAYYNNQGHNIYFGIIEILNENKEILSEKERYYINTLKPKYNIHNY